MSEENIIVDEYKLLNVIASGSVSVVWEVQDSSSNEHYAMKLLLAEAMKVANLKAAMKQEAMICKKFDHPNIIRMHTFKQSKLHCYYVMDYFNAPNIKTLLRNNARTVQTRVRRLTECVALALGHIHEKGFIHRDIKPDNVLMSKSNDIKLIDFSLTAPIPNALSGMLGLKSKVISGTRTYLAPEVIKKQPGNIQSDIYSFGILIYECLIGRPPFMGATPNDLLIKHLREKPTRPSDFDPNIAGDMDDFLLRLLAKSPKDRPKDIPQFISEFRSLKIFKEDPELLLKKNQEKREENQKYSVTSFLTSREDAERREKLKSQQGSEKSSPEIKTQTPAPAKAAAPAVTPATPVSKTPAPPASPQPAASRPQNPAVPAQPFSQPQAYSQPQGQPGMNQSGTMPQFPMGQPGMPLQFPGYPQGVYPGQQLPPQMYPQGYPYQNQQYPTPMGQFPPGYQQPGQPPQPQYYPQQMNQPEIKAPSLGNPQQQGVVGNVTPAVNQSGPQANPPQVIKPAVSQKPPVKPQPPNKPDDDLPFMEDLPDVL